MARAKVYDEFDDAGASFAEETLEEWSSAAFVDDRLAALIQRGVWLTRRSEMSLGMAQTCEQALKFVKARVAWLVRVAGKEGVVFSEAFQPPAPTSKAGKELTLSIHARNVAQWAEAWAADADEALRYYVTISRRAAVNNGWSKADHSFSNKVANALHQERDSALKLVQTFNSISREEPVAE